MLCFVSRSVNIIFVAADEGALSCGQNIRYKYIAAVGSNGMAMLHLFVLNAVILFFPLITDDTVLFHCA
jgi:hypothetical protein